MPRREPIRLRAKQERDRFNDPTGPAPQWRTASATVVPRNSQDYEQRGQIIISGFMIVVGPAVAVADTDEVEVRGQVYQIDGAVADYRTKKLFYVTRAN